CRPSGALVASASIGRNSDGVAKCVVYVESKWILTTSQFHQHIMLIWLHFVLDIIWKMRHMQWEANLFLSWGARVLPNSVKLFIPK
ncbi:hypothetical protein Dimus_007448, partial [Dionaea muscipula]